MNTKNLIIVFLLLAYGPSCVVSSIFSKKEAFNLSSLGIRVHAHENSDLPSSIAFQIEQESSDTEDYFLEGDESLLELASISFFRCKDSIRFHHLNNLILSGSFNPPFSPPETRHS